jgi:TolB protein
VLFSSDRDGNQDIYFVNADGSGLQRLTQDPAADGTPRWSPDGKHIAFVSGREGKPNVYVMNADGSGVTRVSPEDAANTDPVWRPAP